MNVVTSSNRYRVNVGRVFIGFVWALLSGSYAHAQFLEAPKTVSEYPTPQTAAELATYLDRIEAVQAIKKLQYRFGYYQDSGDVSGMASLFADAATVDYAGGKYIGTDSILRLFDNGFTFGSMQGARQSSRAVLNDHYEMQPVIDVSPDGVRAWARFRDWAFQGVAGLRQEHAAGLYENAYVKIDGEWKFSSMAYCESWRIDYLGDIGSAPIPDYPIEAPVTYPENPTGPDKVSSYNCRPWPYAGITPPMHYPHPVTGDYIHKP